MRKDGMTHEAIAEATGVHKTTVLRGVPAFAGTQPTHVIGKDGNEFVESDKLTIRGRITARRPLDARRAFLSGFGAI